MQTRWLLLLSILATLSGCVMHWAPVSSLDDAAGAARVRVSADDREPVILERPARETLEELAHAWRGARIEVRRLSAWRMTLLVTGSILASAAVGFFILVAAVSGAGAG